MIYEVFFAGVGGTVLGALIGAWISSRLTFGFQKLLLQQQLDFQKAQGELDAAFRKQAHDEQMALFTEFRNMMNTRLSKLPGQISSPFDDRM